MHTHLYQGKIISPTDTDGYILGEIIDIKYQGYYSESGIIDIKGRKAILQLKRFLKVSSVSLVFMQLLC